MRVLVTGASRGLGLEFARQYAARGDDVIAACRDPAGAAALAEAAAAHPGKIRIERLDMGDFAAIDAFGARLASESVDVLINNAGLYGPKNFVESMPQQTLAGMDYANWEAVLRINLLAPFRMTAALLPAVARSERRLVLMMSSDLGSIANNGMGGSHAYRSSKAGLNMLTKGLALELQSRGVSVVAMAPGWTRTDLGGPQAMYAPEDSVARQIKTIDGLTPADTGRFVNLDGAGVPW
jgi:NAD(P)-dependent dehydrogenase (short-subunit alcohol dehydrogenase family)